MLAAPIASERKGERLKAHAKKRSEFNGRNDERKYVCKCVCANATMYMLITLCVNGCYKIRGYI